MRIQRLQLKDVGQIKSADIEFGDLTVLVGRQATGKTVFLEMLKLVADKGHIHSQLAKHGFDWEGDREIFLSTYLGEGMGKIWSNQSQMKINGQAVSLDDYSCRKGRSNKNNVFYIPAQRVLTLANGWPRPFQGFGLQDPYVVREFSEQFRMLMDKEFSRKGSLFPKTNRLKKAYRTLLKKHIFGSFELEIDTYGAQKRLVLSSGSGNRNDVIPYMAWSAGQREFVPLLMGLYWLLPAAKTPRRGDLEWVVIEEIEMGLHPSAISTVLLIVMELLSRKYKVILSTHSPHVLDVVWAFQILKKHDPDPDKILELFDCAKQKTTREMAAAVLKKSARVYYFDGDDKKTRDISNLDPGASDPLESGWGGLTEFSGRVADVVASVMQDVDQEFDNEV